VAQLGTALRGLLKADSEYVTAAIDHVLMAANFVPKSQSDEADARARAAFRVLRHAGRETTVWFDYLAASLISTRGDTDLQFINPFLGPTYTARVFDMTVDVLLRCCRIGHTRRCLAALRELNVLLSRLSKMSREQAVGARQSGARARPPTRARRQT
jgi:hypothetical protein